MFANPLPTVEELWKPRKAADDKGILKRGHIPGNAAPQLENFQPKRKLLDYLPGDRSSVMDRGARLVSLSFSKYNPSTSSAGGKKSCIEHQGTLLVNSAMIICKLREAVIYVLAEFVS